MRELIAKRIELLKKKADAENYPKDLEYERQIENYLTLYQRSYGNMPLVDEAAAETATSENKETNSPFSGR